MRPEHAAALQRAKLRLDRLGWYPQPVHVEGVRIAVVPWFFRLPKLRRTYATTRYERNPYEAEARRAVAETR